MKDTFLNTTLAFLVLFFITVFVPAAQGKSSSGPGTFYMVSVGIGDPDNITIRALRTLKEADLIFAGKEERKTFQHLLAGKEVLTPPSLRIHKHLQSIRAENMMVKKENQENGNAVMREIEEFVFRVKKALHAGKDIAYLVQGDPTIYGPNIWIMDALKDLKTTVVPGVSSLNAANAALKKGITFGIQARSAILTNGAALKKEDYQGWDTFERLAASRSTMIFFTMHVDIEELVPELLKFYPPETPIAVVIEAGYKEKERVIQGTLETIRDKVRKKHIPFKNIIYVGDFLSDSWDNIFNN
ncbi:MAG: SAM-dependent methyltransferase [Desulfovermiculus sp.]